MAGRPIPPLFVRAVAGMGHELRGDLNDHPWFHHFGASVEIADEVLMGERLDAMAVRIHEHYVSESLGRGESLGARRSLQHWPQLPEDLKDDNRLVADHHFVKVRDTSCTLADGGRIDAVCPWTGEEIEWLARVEHDRWMHQRLLAGWQQAGKRDDARKMHPDIVPWEALAEDRRELDRIVVRQVPDLFIEIGAAVVRERGVLVTGPRAQWAFPDAFEQGVDAVLDALCAGAAKDALLAWIVPDSALGWRFAEKLLASGRGRLGLILNEPAGQLLGRQPTREIRQRVLTLMQRAVRVRYLPEAMPDELQAMVGATLRVCLSIDGNDLSPEPNAWGLDAAGRVLFHPAEVSA